MINTPSLLEMLKAGMHFGHRTAKWHPAMQKYIFGIRSGVHIINLEKTALKLSEAVTYVENVASSGGTILFVGTKRQAKNAIEHAATMCGMPYVNGRWLGGTFTNFQVIILQTKRLEELEHMKEKGDFEKYTKKERLSFQREIDKLSRNFGGIRSMRSLPDAIFVVDIQTESIALTEARRLHIPVVATTDTNTDPRLVSYPIPSNDDAIKAIELVSNTIADAINEGKKNIKPKTPKTSDSKNISLGKEKRPSDKVDTIQQKKPDALQAEAPQNV